MSMIFLILNPQKVPKKAFSEEKKRIFSGMEVKLTSKMMGQFHSIQITTKP